MSLFGDEATFRDAVADSTSRKQVLEKLGASLAPSNYVRLEKAAEKWAVALPQIGLMGGTRRSVLDDEDRLRDIVSRADGIPDVLRQLGLAVAPANKHRLVDRLAVLGIHLPVVDRRHRKPLENLSRLVGADRGTIEASMRHTGTKGDESELAVAACLRGLGAVVSLPIGGSARYDLIVDAWGRLFRVQVKTGRVRNGSILFSATSGVGSSRRTYGAKELEAIIVYVAELGSVYWLNWPVKQANELSLRLDPVAENQKEPERWAYDYLIGQV